MEEQLKLALVNALQKVAAAAGIDESSYAEAAVIELDIPRDRSHGDFTTNLAMRLAKVFRQAPRKLADQLLAELVVPKGIETVSVAGAGFVNFTLSRGSLADGVQTVLEKDQNWGRQDFGGGRTVNVEFASVNPTGPISVGHGRQAVVGDAVAALMSACGYQVTREYYANDTGRQVEKLGESIVARARQQVEPDAAFPEDGYHGDYIIELAERAATELGPDFWRSEGAAATAGNWSKGILLDLIREDCRALGIVHDVVYSEESLHNNGKVQDTLEFLRSRDLAYEQEGAIWLRSTQFGDDKDRVLVRSEGTSTYALNDAAYHKTKIDRGFEILVDLFGADHHGYMPRLKALVRSLGCPAEDFHILIHQFVTVLREGKVVRMSKRAATFITLRELLDEVGPDVIRYYFLERKMDAQVEFDIEAAKRQSMDNPVYYLQYCHARCSSILQEAETRGHSSDLATLLQLDLDDCLSRMEEDHEMDILRKCLEYPVVLEKACKGWAPHLLIHYGQELARLFQSYYTAGKKDGDLRVVTDDLNRTRARLVLVQAVRITIRNLLQLLGMTAPERM